MLNMPRGVKKSILRRVRKDPVFEVRGYDVNPEEELIMAEDALAAIGGYSEMRRLGERLFSHSNASDVLGEFKVVAARMLVSQMLLGKDERVRGKACLELLDRSLGKPVERMMSLNMEVDGKTDEELEYEIGVLLNEFGRKETGGKGAGTAFVVSGEEPERLEPVEVVQTMGVAGEVFKVSGED
jgi:hypothetical protein